MKRFTIREAIQNQDGSIAILFALTTFVVLGITGVGVDFARATNARAKLQAAVDAAAIAGASLPATANQNRKLLAQRIFKGNLASSSLATVEPTIQASNTAVTVTASYKHSNVIMQAFGFTNVELSSTSTARSQIQNGGVVCMLALSPTSPDGLHMQGINNVTSQDCWNWVNSSSSQAINAVGASQGTAQGFCSTGGVLGGDHFFPVPYTGCEAMADPFYDKFAKYTPEKTELCKYTNLELKNGTYTLEPGTYCGDTIIKPQAYVTFLPGVYVIRDGIFEVQAGSSVVGSEVTLFFYGSKTKMNIRGGANVQLKAPKDGFFGGFVMVDRKLDWYDSSIRETVIQGGGDLRIEGVIYAPQWKINISGNSEMNQASKYFAMIADSFYLEGNGKLFVSSDAVGAGLPSVMPKIKNGPMVLN